MKTELIKAQAAREATEQNIKGLAIQISLFNSAVKKAVQGYKYSMTVGKDSMSKDLESELIDAGYEIEDYDTYIKVSWE